MAFQSHCRTRPDGSREYYGTARPTLSSDGPFQVGDTIINSTGSAGGPYAWRCTAAGSPGTWEAVAKGVKASATKTANYTVAQDDDVLIGSTASAVQFTLPDAALVPGKVYMIKRIGGNNVTIVTAAGAIDAGTTVTLSADKSGCILVSDGVKYVVVASFGTATVS